MKKCLVILFVLLAAIVPPTTAWAQVEIHPSPPVCNSYIGYGGGYYPVAGYGGQDVRAEGFSISASPKLPVVGRVRVHYNTASVKTRPAPTPRPEVIVVEKPAEPVAVEVQPAAPTLKLVDASTGKKIQTVSDWKQRDLRPGTTDIVFTRGDDKREIACYRVVSYADGVAYVQAIGIVAPLKTGDNVLVRYME